MSAFFGVGGNPFTTPVGQRIGRRNVTVSEFLAAF